MAASRVSQLKSQAKVNSKKTKRIYNPDSRDFVGRFKGMDYTIRAGEIEEFPLFIANHLHKHLANHLLIKRDQVNTRDYYLPKIMEEIETKI